MSSRRAKVNLIRAIKINDLETVRDIFVKNPEMINLNSDSDLTSEELNSPFWTALAQGREKIVELFFDFGENPNDTFSFKGKRLSLLHCLSYTLNWEKNKKVAEVLVRRGANVNYHSDTLKLTPVQLAIIKGKVEYVNFLLKNGARPDEGQKNPFYPLSLVLSAPKTNQMEMMRLLIKNGLNFKVLHESTGIDYLQTTILEAIRKPEKIDAVGVAKILVNSGASANHLDNQGKPTLIHSIVLQNVELTALLIETGANVNIKIEAPSGLKFFPIHAATHSKNLALLDLLISNGAEVNAKADKSVTALHIACKKCDKETIDFLVQKRAHVSIENEKVTPFYLLKPEKYEKSKASCINFMIKVIAKQKFNASLAVSKKDIDLMKTHPEVEKYFKSCTEELLKMSNVKFYACYSYYFVFRMSKNKIKKLANLTKNEEFVTNFFKNLQTFSRYGNELLEIMNEAIQLRDRSMIVEFRLKTVFGNCLPDLIIKKLADNLNVEDLPPQQTTDN